MTAVFVLVTVSVTRDDLDLGCPVAAVACPVHRAVTRALPHLRDRLSVGSDWIGVEPDTQIPLPAPAKVNIARIDAMQKVLPFTFDIQVPAHLMTAEVAS